jgi:hypothetical protein
MSTGTNLSIELLRMCNNIGAKNHDVCRSAAVDSSGRELNRNRLIALMSAIVLEEVRFSEATVLLHISILLCCLSLMNSLIYY